jgi:hypothetical protein
VDFSEEEALGSSNLRAPHRECLKSNKQNQSKAQPRKRRPRR